MRTFAAALLCVACYNPTIRPGSFLCDSTNNFVCPDGFCCIQGSCQNMGCGGGGSDGSVSPAVAGCSDGTREGLMNLSTYPTIAACEGAWDQQGIVDIAQQPHCGLQAGNDGVHKDGVNCAAADLCASGWHVCRDLLDMQAHSGAAACNDLLGSSAFFATRQRAAQITNICMSAINEANNVNGCGGTNVGEPYGSADSCMPLKRRLTTATCPAPWNCGTDDQAEGDKVTKQQGAGGVLCCQGV